MEQLKLRAETGGSGGDVYLHGARRGGALRHHPSPASIRR